MHDAHDKIANAGVAIAGFGTGVSWMATFNEFVQIGAGIVAIISGIAAACYYTLKFLRLRALKGDDKDG